ncbi:MAG: phosphopantothenoylcysteine decarboxylase [Planctomycetota bacterium]|nr:MAG: phosphopantothenoylcysteine decarboxylase [Planctomycetota bacterium]
MRVVITSGPTREYLDPVRYLSNASSGRMGAALAEAFLAAGHEVVVVSGPVHIRYPDGASVVPVVTTDEMLQAVRREFASCDGLIGAAAPCDYRPAIYSSRKISKRGDGLQLDLVETPDILANLGMEKGRRWIVGFALETEKLHEHALEKLIRKNCDLIVVNRAEAIDAVETEVGVLDPNGTWVAKLAGDKTKVASELCALIEMRLQRS